MTEDSTERKMTSKDALPVAGSTRRYYGLLRYLGARLYEEREHPRRDDRPAKKVQKR